MTAHVFEALGLEGWSAAYDASGKTTSVTLPDGSVSTTQYLTTVTDAAGNRFTGTITGKTGQPELAKRVSLN